jgi:hypothetical protein
MDIRFILLAPPAATSSSSILVVELLQQVVVVVVVVERLHPLSQVIISSFSSLVKTVNIKTFQQWKVTIVVLGN